LKLTRHNGRSGKNGTYNPRHNDRRFNVENSEHIDAERVKQNVYWDCYRGFTFLEDREKDEEHDFSFEEVERIYYNEHYRDHIEAQNARNAITRHVERNRTVEDLLKNKKTCPEETIYQIGNVDETVSPEELLIVANIFFGELEKRYGEYFHILDWALHVDEGTPHIHERHVFDCENKYGEICPQQEKALEKMGIPLPAPDKPKSRSNNRKKTFDAMCRELLLDICDNRKLYLDKEPEYGGRDYLEKQDYILMKQKEKLADQKEQIAQQEQALEELTLKIEDVEMLIDEVSDVAYDKAVEVVTDRVRLETQKEDLTLIEDYKKWVTSSERNIPKDKRDFVGKCLDAVQNKLIKAAQKVLNAVKDTMMNPKVKAESKEEIKKKAKSSVLDKLNQHRKLIADRDSDTDRTRLQKNKEMER
jgi:serine/arginine repetitive matrix protein 2